jgi:menaquinone-dependent protoporphyrinogen oxidase
MPNSILVTYASRHGATKGIAERLATSLRSAGVDATALPVETVRDVDGYDGFVIGSAVYATHWLGTVKHFVHRHRAMLRRHPVWLFSSGPLSNEPSELAEARPRDLPEIERDLAARDHRVFAGAWDREAPAIGLLERMMGVIPAAREALPAADFRDWAAIDAYGRSIAGELQLALDRD